MYWQTSLDRTIEKANLLTPKTVDKAKLEAWLSYYRDEAPTSSNIGSANVPFQRWFRFKEAFSPKFVTDTIAATPYKVRSCLDPFCGSGTTALTTRFLGIDSISIEVNPFVADLAKAKTSYLSPSNISKELARVLKNIGIRKYHNTRKWMTPSTFREPGKNGRWIFSSEVFDTCMFLRKRIDNIKDRKMARLLRVLLGSALVKNSNVAVNGKGRKYKKNWKERESSSTDLIESFEKAVSLAILDLEKFDISNSVSSKIFLGDARKRLGRIDQADIAIFSPPYPNSFDYTDVYNIELWMLGYLASYEANRTLRKSTLRSHVQTKWPRRLRTVKSHKLQIVLQALSENRKNLWNSNIPEMIAHYFADLHIVFKHLHRILPANGRAIAAIGDSQYTGVHIDVGGILEEVVSSVGFHLIEEGDIRSMRNSAQHGGSLELSEHCLVFKKI